MNKNDIKNLLNNSYEVRIHIDKKSYLLTSIKKGWFVDYNIPNLETRTIKHKPFKNFHEYDKYIDYVSMTKLINFIYKNKLWVYKVR